MFALVHGYEVSRDVSQVLAATDGDLRTSQLLNKLKVADVMRWVRMEQQLIEARQQVGIAMSQDLRGCNSQTGFDVAG